MKTYKDYNYIPLSGTGGTGSEGYDKLLDGDKETRHTGGQTLCVPSGEPVKPSDEVDATKEYELVAVG